MSVREPVLDPETNRVNPSHSKSHRPPPEFGAFSDNMLDCRLGPLMLAFEPRLSLCSLRSEAFMSLGFGVLKMVLFSRHLALKFSVERTCYVVCQRVRTCWRASGRRRSWWTWGSWRPGWRSSSGLCTLVPLRAPTRLKSQWLRKEGALGGKCRTLETLHLSVSADDRRFVEQACADAVLAFGLLGEFLALFVECAGFVDGNGWKKSLKEEGN